VSVADVEDAVGGGGDDPFRALSLSPLGVVENRSSEHFGTLASIWRGDRADECDGLENRWAFWGPEGSKSLPLRQKLQVRYGPIASRVAGCGVACG